MRFLVPPPHFNPGAVQEISVQEISVQEIGVQEFGA
jgi:hypothetical protein